MSIYLGISKEKFNACIEELESAGYIKKVEPDAGISGHILTAKGNDELNIGVQGVQTR